jgi:hypothetical protein
LRRQAFAHRLLRRGRGGRVRLARHEHRDDPVPLVQLDEPIHLAPDPRRFRAARRAEHQQAIAPLQTIFDELAEIPARAHLPFIAEDRVKQPRQIAPRFFSFSIKSRGTRKPRSAHAARRPIGGLPRSYPRACRK